MEACGVFEIVSERFVKPSTESPPSLKCYKLSYTDQIALPVYVPLAFFYINLKTSQEETSQILETALSKTLSYYYPFAGSLKDNLFVECNDMGVPFREARFRCSMTELNPQLKNLVFHNSCVSNHAGDAIPLLVQITYFDCSGIAVSICMSHKLGDASTLCAFMCDWAAMVRQSNAHIPSPLFIGASLFPPLEEEYLDVENPSITLPPAAEASTSSVNSVKKFLFCDRKISQLKDIVAKSSTGTIIKNPTRFEVVAALLYRCAMVSSKAFTVSAGTYRHAMSLRRVAEAELPEGCVGNFVNTFEITTEKNKEEDITLPELVSKLRNAKLNAQNQYKSKAKENGSLSLEDLKVLMKNPSMSSIPNNFYSCTSWCRIPFYEVDFGWGKPLSLAFPSMAAPVNHFTLIDIAAGNDDEDSIQAIIMLKEANHMSAFQTNEELLTFASVIDD